MFNRTVVYNNSAADARRLNAYARVEADNPGITEALKTDHPIVKDIALRFDRWGNMSPKQIALVFRLAADSKVKAEAAATAPKIEAGKATITGKVTSLKIKSGPYGDSIKMVVATEAGHRFWGTVPTSIQCVPLKGATVTFTATVTPSDRDPLFAFYSRPTKATVDAPATLPEDIADQYKGMNFWDYVRALGYEQEARDNNYYR